MQPRLAVPTLASGTLVCALLLSGCQTPPAAVAEAPATPLPLHRGPPPAATCSVTPFHVADGGTTEVAMTISNDGGYCAATLTAGNGQPYDAPLVPARPLHGDETVVRYNGKTSVEYSAKPGYVGPDSFTVRLILRGQSGYTTLNVSVNVQGTAKTS